MRTGVPVSPGVAVAHAYRVDEVLARRDLLRDTVPVEEVD